MSGGDMSHPPLSRTGKEALLVASHAVREAGAILKSRFSQEKKVQSKGKRNLATDIDLLAEKRISELLRDEYPDHRILGEELGETEGTSDYCWIIDPLDGTTNYAYGIPFFAVSLGLTCKDEIILGIVYDPMRDELFWALKGRGAFLNDSAIGIASTRIPHTTVIGFDLGYNDARTREMLSRINAFWSGEMVLRLMGSAALGLAYVACGRMDIYLHLSIYPWDMAGGILLIREAGGEVSDWQGNPATVWDDKIIASGTAGERCALLGRDRDGC
ncbi:MAG: Inositol-1-monophosphatase [Chloroflexi bacterium]|nr:Inositol-1-monophosphatase [Chloroflexota bacterium]